MDFDAKAPREGEDHLLTFTVGMPTAFSVDGHIVKIINPSNVERNVFPTLDEGQVTPQVVDEGKINEDAGGT